MTWIPGDPIYLRAPGVPRDCTHRNLFDIIPEAEDEIYLFAGYYQHGVRKPPQLACPYCRVAWIGSELGPDCWVCGKPGESFYQWCLAKAHAGSGA